MSMGKVFDFCDFLTDRNEESHKEECKGLRFRYKENFFTQCDGKGGIRIEQQFKLNLLKRKSCSGCDQCGGLYELIENPDVDILIEGLEDGKIYEPKPKGSGYREDYELEYVYFVEVKDEC